MTAAMDVEAPHSTVLDIHTQQSAATDGAALYSSVPSTAPNIGLPFRASADSNSVHAALSVYLTSYGFLCLLLFAGLNMRMLASPSLSTAAGEQPSDIKAFCYYSLALMLALLLFAFYLHSVMSGGMLRAKAVRGSDRVLLDGEWLAAQRSHSQQCEQANGVSLWSLIRTDRAVRGVLTLSVALYCGLSLAWSAAGLSLLELLVLLAAGGALIALAVLTDDLLLCMSAFVLGDWLQPLIAASLLGCPVLHSVSSALLLTTCQLLLCTIVYVAARASSRPLTLLLFLSTLHCRLLVVQPTYGTVLTFAACALCSFPLHRLSLQQPPQPTAPMDTSTDNDADDADISEELWRVKQFVCMAALYALAANGWRSVHCLLGDGLVHDVMCLAALLMLGVREYMVPERHKQV